MRVKALFDVGFHSRDGCDRMIVFISRFDLHLSSKEEVLRGCGILLVRSDAQVISTVLTDYFRPNPVTRGKTAGGESMKWSSLFFRYLLKNETR